MAAYITGGNLPVDGGITLTGSSSMSRGMQTAFEGAALQARSGAARARG